MSNLGINGCFKSKRRLMRGSQFITNCNLTSNDRVSFIATIRSVDLFCENFVKIIKLIELSK